MLQALLRTMTEMADSKKAGYSILATIILAVLIVYFKVDSETAGVIVAPLVVGTVAQAHVDAAEKKSQTPAATGPVNIGEVKTDATPPAPAS
jgi:predicted short-subunit dehydrogenase-like oxidoreductase (DUF2520 family)